jgi:hypothetical protein
VADLTSGGDGEATVADCYRRTVTAGELAEGVSAFIERRPPRFPVGGGMIVSVSIWVQRGYQASAALPPEAGIGAAFSRAADCLPARP